MSSSPEWTPTVVRPADLGGKPGGPALADHLRAAELDRLLVAAKAVVFRDFEVTVAELDTVLDRLLPHRLAYVHGNSPRTKVGANVYTSTEYPPEYTISMHNELSYAAHWPARLVFFCERAPETGGATTVVDGERWLASLDAEVRDAFADGVRYTQNLHGGIGLGKSWQSTFETTDRAEVEAFLDRSGANWKWLADGTLRLSQIRPATTRHPVTGVEVWFNQSDQWHPATLGEDTAQALAELLPAEDLPQAVTFADGGEIPARYVEQVRDRGLAGAVHVAWRPGDLLVIDNVLVAHGRAAFTGPRRVLVAMSD